MRFSLIAFITIMFAVFGSGASRAQYVKANVTMKLEKLHQDQRMKLHDLDRRIKEYIENNKWSRQNNAFDEFSVDITIAIDDLRTGFEDVYSARFFIVSTTGYQEADKEWRFTYRLNQPMIFDPNMFESLTGLIDFYMYIIIGELVDTYEVHGGTEYYNKALLVSELGKSDRYNRWWEKRNNYVRRYLQESHKPFRKMTACFYAAHYWTLENDETEARKAAEETIQLLQEVDRQSEEQEFRVDFFKRHFQDLALVFAPYDDIYEQLITLDPDRKEFYRNYRKR